MVGSHEGGVASISERRDDESGGVAQKLIAVQLGGVDDLDLDRDHVFEGSFGGLVIVESQLAGPLEVLNAAHILLIQRLDDISRVHIQHHHRTQSHSVERLEVSSDQLDNVLNLVIQILMMFLQSLLILLDGHDSLFGLLSPDDHINCENYLGLPI